MACHMIPETPEVTDWLLSGGIFNNPTGGARNGSDGNFGTKFSSSGFEGFWAFPILHVTR